MTDAQGTPHHVDDARHPAQLAWHTRCAPIRDLVARATSPDPEKVILRSHHHDQLVRLAAEIHTLKAVVSELRTRVDRLPIEPR